MIVRLLIGIAIGGGIGAMLGYWGKCASGACPLTATWQRGAIFGGILGLMFVYMSGAGSGTSLNESTANVKRISPDQFDMEVIQAGSPVVVDFYATWCGPCRALSPRLDKLAGSFTNQIKFVKINYDEATELVRRYDIQGIPTLLFFESGKITSRMLGLVSEDTLKAQLDALAGMKSANAM